VEQGPRTVELALHLVGFAVLGVDGSDEAVLGDVREMTTVLQPGSTGRYVVSCALALHLNQNGQVLRVLAIPLLEGLEELETVTCGLNHDLDREAILRRGLEGVLSRVISARRELKSRRSGEFERSARGGGQGVGKRVEGE